MEFPGILVTLSDCESPGILNTWKTYTVTQVDLLHWCHAPPPLAPPRRRFVAPPMDPVIRDHGGCAVNGAKQTGAGEHDCGVGAS